MRLTGTYAEVSEKIHDHKVDDNDRSKYSVHNPSEKEPLSQPITELPTMRIFEN